MKKLRILFAILVAGAGFTSCNGWLDLYPENSQTSDQYWQTKEDVESVVAAGYVKLQKSIDYLFVWGEIRGNGIDIKSATVDDNIKAAQKLREMDILPTNVYAKWDKMYQVINMANSVIKYAPFVLDRDPSFNESQMNSLLSEAYFQRSLAYFYLVRTFRDVPLILYPYVNDEQQYEMEKSDEEIILTRLVDDLKAALPAAKEFFPETDYNNPIYSKGRATKWAIQSLIAEIELWRGNYDACITACDVVLNSGRVGLIAGDYWYTNFNPGNSNESIFEIQFKYTLGQTNAMFAWFETSAKYTYSEYTLRLFTDTESKGDIRGNGSSFTSKDGKIWKYIGLYVDKTATAKRSSSTENDNNFIVYRLADIYLMKAESYIMKGNFSEALALITKVRERAKIVDVMAADDTQKGMLNLLLEERNREFFAEGKRWFDLLRMAKRNNYEYKDYLIEHVASVAPTNKVSLVTSKLADVNSYYLPIHQDELNANHLLEQNPYYSNLGN